MLSTRTGSLPRSRFRSFNTSSPPRPGIVMSSSTMSHGSLRTFSSSSVALAASPATFMSGSSASICLRPCRTTGWSSAIRILIMSVDRYARRHGGAFSPRAPDGDLAAEQERALPHAQNSERSGIGKLVFGNPVAVVPYLEAHVSVGPLQLDPHFGRVRVAGDVGERFLENAEERGRARAAERDVFEPRGQLAFDPGALLKLVDLPFDRRGEPQIVQDARPELGRDAAHGPDGLIHQRQHRIGFLPERLLIPGQLFAHPRQVHLESGERLAELVVDLARDP